MDSSVLSNSFDVDAIINASIERQANLETTQVGSLIGKAALKKLAACVDSSVGKPLNISFQMHADEQASMRRDFPGRSLNFTNTAHSSHAFAAAHRVAETDLIYSMFNTTQERIIDLGGNFVTHAKMKRSNVHSCCPVLDARDGARFTDRLMYYQGACEKRTASQGELELDYCTCRFQDCNVPAQWAMAIHSISDNSIGDVVVHCFRRGVRKLIASVMMDPLMLIQRKGRMLPLNVMWEREGEGDDETISFHFVDAPGFSYTHSYKTLCSYMTTNQVIINNRVAYRVERTSNLSGVFIVEITQCLSTGNDLTLSPLRDVSCVWLSELNKKQFVKLAKPVVSGWFHQDIDVQYVLMDKAFVRRISEVAFRQYKTETCMTKAVQQIATYISSASNHCIINGITMQSGAPVDVSDYVPLAVTFFAHAKMQFDSIEASYKAIRTPFTEKSVLNPLRVLFGGARTISEDGMSMRCINHSVWAEAWKAIASTIGFDAGYVDGDVFVDPPPFLLASDVWKMWMQESGPKFSHRLDVDFVYWDAKAHYFEKFKKGVIEAEAEEERKIKVDNAMIKIAALIDKEVIPDGLIDLLDFKKIEAQLKEPVHSERSDTDAIVSNDYSEAIKESIRYITQLDTVNRENLVSFGGFLSWGRDMRALKVALGVSDDRWVYVPSTRKWHGSVRDTPTFERGYTELGYIDLQWVDGQLSDKCAKSLLQFKAVFCTESCIFDSGTRMLDGLEKALNMPAKFKVKIVDGVAGCGKTTYLKRISRLDGVEHPDIILTSNATSAQDLKREIECHPMLKTRIRTVDSYLMMKKWLPCKRMLFDECFLQHAGIIYAAATLSGCDELIAQGDDEQIPWIPRIPSFQPQHSKLQGEVEIQSTTYRSPRDATLALGRLYKKKPIFTKSMVPRSMELIPIVSETQIPIEKDVLYITHTKADKAKLSAIRGMSGRVKTIDELNTTHEAQGKTYDKVILFRLSRTTNLLHSGKNPSTLSSHNLVAISRHRKSLRYYTVASNDMSDELVPLFGLAKNATDDDLRACFIK